MTLSTCIELPNQAAIAYSMALDQLGMPGLTFPCFGEDDPRTAYWANPKITTHRRLWPLTGLSYWQEWSGIVLVHGQGR